jgi:hypothetical protein
MARTKRTARSRTCAISSHYSESSGELDVLQRIEARRRKRGVDSWRAPKDVLDVAIEAVETHAAPPWRPVGNPDATFLGLAIEVYTTPRVGLAV